MEIELHKDADFGSGVGDKPTDYKLEKIPKPLFKFVKGDNEYNQNKVNAYSCTIFGAMGCVTDQAGYKFDLKEQTDIFNKAVKAGLDPEYGWYLSSAVDLVRGWWNERQSKKLLTFRVDRLSPEFWELMEKGYSVAVAFRGNSTYNKDKNDGTLDGTNFGRTSYGHIVRVCMLEGELYIVVDNYKGITHNTYQIPVENWAELDNFYDYGYVFITEDEYRKVNKEYNQISSWGEEAIKELGHLFDDLQPQKPLEFNQVFWSLHKFGKELGIDLIENPEGEWTQERWLVVLNRIKNLIK